MGEAQKKTPESSKKFNFHLTWTFSLAFFILSFEIYREIGHLDKKKYIIFVHSAKPPNCLLEMKLTETASNSTNLLLIQSI